MNGQHTSTIDIFNQDLIDYGTLQLIADVNEETARLQLSEGHYGNVWSLAINKQTAFTFFHNASIHTFTEMATMLTLMGARSR